MRTFLILIIIPFLAACSSDGGNDKQEVNAPKAANLIFPEANSECTEGTNKTETKSTIKFEWTASEYTDSYTLVIKNLNTQASQNHATNNTFKEVTLDRGEAYSWYVSSMSNNSSEVAKSDTRKFYNASEGSSSYAPFPAELNSPTNRAVIKSTVVSLNWNATDIDNDIDEYDVYLSKTNPPSLLQANVKTTSLENIAVETGKTYYWKVVTKDKTGNISTSETYLFNVK